MQSPVLEFDKKKCTQSAYFPQKVDFCIFEIKTCEVIENSSKTPLNLSALQCSYLGKNSFLYHQGLVRKKKLKSGYLELRFNVDYSNQGGGVCRNFKGCNFEHTELSIYFESFNDEFAIM